MRHHSKLAASGFILSAFLLAVPALGQDQTHMDANGMPTDHSTPAEQAQTRALNNQISNGNQQSDDQAAAANAQYQAQQQQYQEGLQENQAAQQRYQDDSAAYERLREHYAAARSTYRRDVWPAEYQPWGLRDLKTGASLLHARVEITNGDRVGTVTAIAQRGGRVEGIEVSLDSGKRVWLDADDARFNRSRMVVMTDLDRNDLHAMADERS